MGAPMITPIKWLITCDRKRPSRDTGAPVPCASSCPNRVEVYPAKVDPGHTGAELNQEAIRHAERMGWVRIDDTWYCPSCATERLRSVGIGTYLAVPHG